MLHITLDDEQAKIIRESTVSIEIRDGSGNHLGFVVPGLTHQAVPEFLASAAGARHHAHGFTDEDIAIAKERRASNAPRYTTQDVLEHLRSLENQERATGAASSSDSNGI